jgi:predicted transcriptional regulator
MYEKFTEKDQRLISALIKACIPKNVAKTLVYLAIKNEATSQEIETFTGLRQPEVSIAVQELRKRNWVTKRDWKKEGKGRPVHYYRLAIPFSKIIEQIEESEKERAKDLLGNVELIKTMARDYYK